MYVSFLFLDLLINLDETCYINWLPGPSTSIQLLGIIFITLTSSQMIHITCSNWSQNEMYQNCICVYVAVYKCILANNFLTELCRHFTSSPYKEHFSIQLHLCKSSWHTATFAYVFSFYLSFGFHQLLRQMSLTILTNNIHPP